MQNSCPCIDYDLIVGLPSIRELELIKHLPSLFLNENKPSIGDSGGPSAGVYPQPILASYAEGGMSNKKDEVVISDPPFSPSGTIHLWVLITCPVALRLKRRKLR